MPQDLKPFTLACYGTSLTTGRLSSDWVIELKRDLQQQEEAKGEVIVYNAGKGSQTSDWGRENAYTLTALRPSHILFEGFGINDCAIGPVSLVQAAINFNSMVDQWQAGIPGVYITHQTMSPAAASDTNRTQLQNYYNQELSLATAQGITSLDHTPGWPAITALNTFNGDLLHPIWPNVFQTYSYPTILTWAKARMAEYWP